MPADAFVRNKRAVELRVPAPRRERHSLPSAFLRRVNSEDWGEEVQKFELDCMLSCYGRFRRALELGCGSGRLSLHLSDYADEVVATEIDFRKVVAKETGKVKFSQMDAQDLSRFGVETFDLVFSSNVLEHIPAVERCVAECRRVIQPDGLVIHTVPNNTWKVFSLAMYYPAHVASAVERARCGRCHRPPLRDSVAPAAGLANRPRRITPKPHGVATSHLEEFQRWQGRRWVKLFTEAGFDVVRTARLPFYYGYRQMFAILLDLGNRAGLSACTGYVLRPRS